LWEGGWEKKSSGVEGVFKRGEAPLF
jgi:hypothetical protein